MRVELYGDSQAQGLEAPLRAALAARGHELVHVSVHPGASAKAALEQLARGAPVDLVIVAAGGNDDATASYPDQLRAAAERLLGRAPRVVWIGPMWSGEALVDARHARAAVVQRAVLPGAGIGWLSGRALSHGRELAGDGVHFTRKGYTAIATDVVSMIEGSEPALVIGTLAIAAAVVTLAFVGAEAIAG